MIFNPPYTLINSQRAKSVRLKICRINGLQMVVPRRFNTKRIPDILHKNQKWILRNWHHIADNQSHHKTSLPQELDLLFLNEKWQIQYYPQEIKDVKIKTQENNMIKISGKIQDITLVITALKKWLKRKAKEYLIAELNKISQITQLTYTSASIRDTHTRWGSCSAKKRISLNFKLLFLPSELVEYILIHELCHTIHLNHSIHFWRLVGNFCPNHTEARKKLKQISFHLPLWLEKGFVDQKSFASE